MTIPELRTAVIQKYEIITPPELYLKVTHSVIEWFTACIQSDGKQFEHLLK